MGVVEKIGVELCAERGMGTCANKRHQLVNAPACNQSIITIKYSLASHCLLYSISESLLNASSLSSASTLQHSSSLHLTFLLIAHRLPVVHPKRPINKTLWLSCLGFTMAAQPSPPESQQHDESFLHDRTARSVDGAVD